jgi:hypothetical protein
MLPDDVAEGRVHLLLSEEPILNIAGLAFMEIYMFTAGFERCPFYWKCMFDWVQPKNARSTAMFLGREQFLILNH